MGQTFSSFSTTSLPRERVWELLTDVSNWPKFSDIYAGPIRWVGEPWVPGSILVGELKYPLPLDFEYLLKVCEPPDMIRYLSHSVAAGFAIERTVRLLSLGDETMISVDAYAVGEPTLPIPGGSLGFMKMQTERWLNAFARFCDQHCAPSKNVVEAGESGASSHSPQTTAAAAGAA
jgi:hypothetical protein